MIEMSHHHKVPVFIHDSMLSQSSMQSYMSAMVYVKCVSYCSQTISLEALVAWFEAR
jgi:ferritin